MKISLIAAMAKDRVIGIDNQMPWHLPADFQWFKSCTLAKPIVMGRKTFESIGRPLPGRRNIVISRDQHKAIPGVEVVSSTSQALELVKEVDEVMIIGGGTIYQAFLPLATHLYLTHVEASVDGDTYFPDWGEGWQVIKQEQHDADERNQYAMRFEILSRTKSEPSQ